MKFTLLLSIFTAASAFHVSPSAQAPSSLSAEKVDRRAAFGMLAGAAAVFPSAAMAAVGESPKVSVFGILGDGTALSEGAAYGSDQSADNYSPYSVYSNVGPDSSYIKNGGKDAGEYVARKKAVIAETKVRLGRIPAYVEKKKWFEVKNELTRYMYETRGACNYLAKSVDQKEAAADFFKAIERITLNTTLKNQEGAFAAQKEAIEKLDKFSAMI
ncbi:hypothetical protein TrCOL_g4870 [Triparma columacea]|uniref:Extrinsic protein in photosystem II n=1 Tax=Triparma columacea TaxID=722753 RepID=A0A9W7GLK6_9STRA|nr:hypothetical protein TrCOL_g4870 [Triparma columacea]